MPQLYDSSLPVYLSTAVDATAPNVLFQKPLPVFLPEGAVITAPLPGIPVANNTFVAGTATDRTLVGTFRRPHIVAVAVTELRFVYSNWANNGTAATPNNQDVDTGAAVVIRASVEVAGTIYRLTFNGAQQVSIDGGAFVVSDPIALDLAAGTTIYSRTFVASGTWKYNGYTGALPNGGGGYVATTDLTAPGAAAVADTANQILYTPSAIIGTPVSSLTSVLIVGDSIAHGFGDAPGATAYQGRNATYPQLAGGGFIARALYGALGYLQAAIPGDRATDFVVAAGHFRRMAWAASATVMVCEYGRNDVSAARTAAQIEADLVAVWTLGANRKIRVYQTTITPRSTSTDFWRTTGAQTVDATNAVRVAVNAWIRAGAPLDPATKAPVAVGTVGALIAGRAGHPLVGYFEVTNLVETAQDSGIFKAAANVRSVTDAAATAGSPLVTSATAAFTTADLGRVLTVTASGSTFQATIQAINSASSVTVSVNAPSSVSAAQAYVYDAYSSDGTHLTPYGAAAAAAGIPVATLA